MRRRRLWLRGMQPLTRDQGRQPLLQVQDQEGTTAPETQVEELQIQQQPKEAAKAAQQLKAAQDLVFASENRLRLLKEMTPIEKLQEQATVKKLEIERTYAKKLEESATAAETALLQVAQTNELKAVELDLEKQLADLREGAVSGIEDEIALLEAKLAGKEEEYKITKAIKDLEAQGVSSGEAEALVKRKAELEGLVQSQTKLKESLEATTGVIADNLGQAFKDVITGAKSAEEALQQAFASIGEAFIDMAIDIIKQQLVMIANGMLMKALGIGGGVSSPVSGGGYGDMSVAGPSFFSGGMIPGFAQGGYVDQPTKAMIGESGPEYVIPASKLDSAMQKYAAGQRGDQITQGGVSASPGNGEVAGAPTVNYSGPILSFNSEDYVPASAVNGIIEAAAAKGAKAGQMQTMNTLKNSRGSRSKIGL